MARQGPRCQQEREAGQNVEMAIERGLAEQERIEPERQRSPRLAGNARDDHDRRDMRDMIGFALSFQLSVQSRLTPVPGCS